MSSILVTGSSGFIGECLINTLLDTGYKVIGLDLVPSKIVHTNFTSYIVDLTDANFYRGIKETDISLVCHLAAKIRVDESMYNPKLYYENNILGTLNLLNWCCSTNILNIIFASTAAVYGEENSTVYGFKESDAGHPKSVYGKTKLFCEQMLQDYAMAYGIRGYVFRFFNVCGGSELNHGQPIHLLPLVVDNLIKGKDIKIFGTDYVTKDGTCVRDYIHLLDISNAFILAISKGFNFKGFKIYNLGSNSGYTVKEIIYKICNKYKEMKQISIDTLHSQIIYSDRRSGDCDILIANSSLASRELGWSIKYNLDTMVTDTIKSFGEI